MDSIKRAFSSSNEEEDSSRSSRTYSFGSVSDLGWKNRVIGFSICAIIAGAGAILGCALGYIDGVAGYVLFGLLFSAGTVAGVCATFFIMGPIRQAKGLWDPDNWINTGIRISCIVAVVIMVALAFCAVYWWKIPGLAILFCIIEFVAIVIYAITLVPYATSIISRGARGAWSSL